MMIADDMEYNIAPLHKMTKYAHGYCCESHDSGPAENSVSLIKEPASAKLIQLANFARDNKIEGYGLQRAVWCVSNDHPLEEIQADEPENTKKLIEFTGPLKGYSDGEIKKLYALAAKRGGKVYEKMVNINLPVERDTYMWILIQDVNNNTVKTVMTKQVVKKGVFQKNIGLSSLDYGSGTFIVRVYSTDKAVVEKRVKLDI
jgi:hypothetical protein